MAEAEFRSFYRDFSVADKLADVKAVSAELVVAAAVAAADAKVAKVVPVDVAPDVKGSDSKSKLTRISTRKKASLTARFF